MGAYMDTGITLDTFPAVKADPSLLQRQGAFWTFLYTESAVFTHTAGFWVMTVFTVNIAAVRFPGPSTLLKGMILFTTAFTGPIFLS